VVGYRTGVEAFGQTIVNSGTIKGTSGYAVQHAKELVNYGVVDSIRVAAAEYCYTILNYGLLESTGTIGDISVNGIKYLTNENAGVILGTVRLNSGGSVANEGHIETGSYSASGFAVAFYDFGYLTNAVDGVIDGGVRTFEDTVINRGTIDGLSGPGELLQRSDLTNQTGGLITGLYGVSDESYATNFGTIEGGVDRSGTVINDGTIKAAGGTALRLKLGDGASATVINGRYGLIKGAYGVVFAGQATGTLVDCGTIVGLADDAVAFQSADEALVVEGGAAVIGEVVGAGGLLELGGDGLAGTIGYLGSEVTGFQTYLIDASASWTLTGGNVITSGDRLTNAGSLELDGALTLDDGSSFTNTGQITVLGLESRLHDLADLSGDGSITLTDGGILNLNGSAGGVIDFYGSGTLKLHEPLAVSSQIENFGVEGVIDLKDVPFSKHDTVSYAAGQLIVSGAAGVYADLAASGVIIPSGDQLALRNDGTGKTEIVIETSAQSADSQGAADLLRSPAAET
jgi:hypothetical protein